MKPYREELVVISSTTQISEDIHNINITSVIYSCQIFDAY